MLIVGIQRAPRFSPCSTLKDEAIFNAVSKKLLSLGHEIKTYAEDDNNIWPQANVFFSMARSKKTLQRLSKEEQKGVCIFNSPTALLDMNRLRISETFLSKNIPTPLFSSISTKEDNIPLPFPFWIKRYDTCAQQKDDICFVENEKEWFNILQKKATEKAKIMAMKHVEGVLVKCYGVYNTDFFQLHIHATDKYGHNKHNTMCSCLLNSEYLHKIANKAAEVTGIHIYGADFIVDNNKNINIIDFNDWPSFSSCTEEAANAITQYIHHTL